MQAFLNLRRIPGRISLQQVAWWTGIAEHSLIHVEQVGILRRLGGRAAKNNCGVWFSSAAVARLVESEDLMSKATEAVIKANRDRNGNGKKPDLGQDGDPSLN